jgi:hypothetical protein
MRGFDGIAFFRCMVALLPIDSRARVTEDIVTT